MGCGVMTCALLPAQSSFYQFDRDRSGALDRGEVQQALAAAGASGSAACLPTYATYSSVNSAEQRQGTTKHADSGVCTSCAGFNLDQPAFLATFKVGRRRCGCQEGSDEAASRAV
jgi:hypothetical protein